MVAYERGEPQDTMREGRVYDRLRRLTRRQKRTCRHSLYRSGASILIRHQLALPPEDVEVGYTTGQTLFVDGGLLLPPLTVADYLHGDRADRDLAG